MNAKERAVEIYTHHIALASTDGRLFRKTVMDQLMAETGCSLAAAATHYNNAKKGSAPIEGLGRAPVAPGVRKMGGSKPKQGEVLIPDEDCFTVIELVQHGPGSETVGRCQSFILQGDASEKFDSKKEFWPNSVWVMIKGLGPNTGDTYKLDPGEKEIKRYTPATETAEA
jgi:hypothetical protein